MRTHLLARCFFVLAGTLAVACGGKTPPKEPVVDETVADAGAEDAAPPEPPAPKSLYERVGGKEMLAKITDSFLKNAQANDVIKKRFAKLPKGKEKLAKFGQDLVDRLCREAGGDCAGASEETKPGDKGTKIGEAEWTAFVSAFKAALDEHEIGETEQDDFIALLAPMHDDLVEAKPKGKK